MGSTWRPIVGVLVFIVMTSAAAAEPAFPKPLLDVLARVGVPAEALQSIVGGRVGGSSTTTDPHVASQMERARGEDVVVSPNDALFDDSIVGLGVWQSTAFLRDYGTALLLAAPYDERRIPVVLVHGINGSPRDLAGLVTQFHGSAYQPVLFFYPTGMPLAEASGQLRARLREFLDRHPSHGFAIVGHSMGGLVAKGMLDEFDGARTLPGLKVFVAISTPWSGVPAAAHAERLPGHPPSWDDLAPRSRFMSRIKGTPMPSRLAFYMFFGARSRPSLLTALGNNDGRLTVDAMNDTAVTADARDVFGFYEDHVSILSAPRMFDRLEAILARDLRGGHADRLG